MMLVMIGVGVLSFFIQFDISKENFLKDNYFLFVGSYLVLVIDVVLIVDGNNNININVLKNFGFDVKEDEKFDFDEIVGIIFKLVNNNIYYIKFLIGNFIFNIDYDVMYQNVLDELKILGILWVKFFFIMNFLLLGIVYSD